jgi:hypothetical protein
VCGNAGDAGRSDLAVWQSIGGGHQLDGNICSRWRAVEAMGSLGGRWGLSFSPPPSRSSGGRSSGMWRCHNDTLDVALGLLCARGNLGVLGP